MPGLFALSVSCRRYWDFWREGSPKASNQDEGRGLTLVAEEVLTGRRCTVAIVTLFPVEQFGNVLDDLFHCVLL